MEKLRIGVFLSENIPSYWAHSFNVMKMAQGFKNIGCQVEVITSNNINAIKLRNEIQDIRSHYGIKSHLKITYLDPSITAFHHSKIKNDHVFCHNAAQYAIQNKFDLVYSRSNYRIPYLTAKAGIPSVIEAHSRYSFTDAKWKQKFSMMRKFRHFRGVITIHEDLKSRFVQRGLSDKQIMVIEDGVDLNGFNVDDHKLKWRKKFGLNPDKEYMVYCGSLFPEKGIEVILQVAKKMEARPNLEFLLLGGREKEIKEWKSYVRKHEIRNVRFLGFIPNALVPQYLKVADGLILAYKMANMQYKVMDVNTTSPLKLFEYMAAKRPIVATSIPTITKVLKQGSNSLLVKPDDLEDYCAKIRLILDDQELGSRLANQAYQDSNLYSWDERCKKILRFALG